MSGRHRPGGGAHERPRPTRPRRRFAVLGAALVVLAGLGSYAAYAGGGDAPSAARPANHRATPCTGTVQLPVIATPELLGPVRAVAAAWAHDRTSIDGRCATAVVNSSRPADALSTLAFTDLPILWLPDSSVWTARLSALRPGVVAGSTSLATSPLVLATNRTNASAARTAARGGWPAVIAHLPLVITEPASTATGDLLVTTAAGEVRTAADRTRIGNLFLQLGNTALATPTGAFAQVAVGPRGGPAFVTSEHDARAAAADGTDITTVYPAGATAALDYPAVRVVPPGSDRAVADAAAAFARALRSKTAQAALARTGLRDPGGRPLGDANNPVHLAPPASAAQEAAANRMYQQAVKPAQLLAAIDVSGSMKDPARRGGTAKITLATSAIEVAMERFPLSWRIGLWSFSTSRRASHPWTELVPLGAVSANRGQLLDAARSLPKHVGGNTGLYDTVLAAFEQVRQAYRAGSVNTVAVLTDGANRNPGSTLTLDKLLSRLNAEYSRSRPVHVVTIGLGSGADMGALRAISDATGGRSYQIDDPAQIQSVLLDAMQSVT
jgi:Ca-activated chloride channel homolog